MGFVTRTSGGLEYPLSTYAIVRVIDSHLHTFVNTICDLMVIFMWNSDIVRNCDIHSYNLCRTRNET